MGLSVSTIHAGVGANLARDVPFSMLFWGSLEPVRHWLLREGSQTSPGQILAANCAAGGLGGAAAAAITTPLVRLYWCCDALVGAHACPA